MLALILSIVGGTRISSSHTFKHNSEETFKKACAIISLISYVIVAFAMLAMAESRDLPRGEKCILYAVLVSLSFLAVRLLYSLLADFEDNNTFNTVGGNATVQLCMAIIQEFVVTFFFLVADLVAPALDSLVNGAGGIPMNSYSVGKGVA